MDPNVPAIRPPCFGSGHLELLPRPINIRFNQFSLFCPFLLPVRSGFVLTGFVLSGPARVLRRQLTPLGTRRTSGLGSPLDRDHLRSVFAAFWFHWFCQLVGFFQCVFTVHSAEQPVRNLRKEPNINGCPTSGEFDAGWTHLPVWTQSTSTSAA